MSRRPIVSALCAALLMCQFGAAQSTTAPATPASSDTGSQAPSPDDLKQLQEKITQQQEQIKRLQQSVEEQQKLLEQSLEASKKAAEAAKAQAAADAAKSQTASNHSTTNNAPTNNGTNDGTPIVPTSAPAPDSGNLSVKLIHAVDRPPTSGTLWTGSMIPTTMTGHGGQHTTTTPPSELSIKIGNTTFSPLGFVDATFFGRSTNVGSGIGTNFGSIPYNTSNTGHLSETNFTTQNSRIGFRVDSNVLGAQVLGYFEADFLGNQPTTVFVSSNADTFRMRNVFVDIQKHGFEFLAGQDWSMLTPNRKGLSPLPSDIFYTQDMDTNYQAGLIWSRQTQFRFIAHPTENFAFGLSLENPEQYIGGANGAGVITAPAAYVSAVGSSSVNGQFNNGQTNYGAPNVHPDIVFKGAYDGHVGDKLMHVEAGGVIRSFKYAAGLGKPAIYNTYSASAVSGTVNANLEIFKNVHLIANTFFGSGGGRYIFGQAPDVVVRADGSIAPLHSYSTVDGFEANVAKNTLLYAYYGGIYIGKYQVFDSTAPGSTLATPVYVGYGYQGAPNSQNRSIQEGTIGIVQTFWKSANYGALSLITQYSYLTRNPWYLASNAPSGTHTNMYWIDVRYTLP